MSEVPGDAGYDPEKFKKQDICCRCGARTYKDFKKTGKAHVCKDLK